MAATDEGMTVGELIRHLSGFPKDMLVVVDGYEGGFDDPSPPRKVPVRDELGREKSDPHSHYDGRYELDPDGPIEAVVVPRPDGDASLLDPPDTQR